jgi:Predicted AAA-ATPase/PD-(D/E)XK nuclease superfamily
MRPARGAAGAGGVLAGDREALRLGLAAMPGTPPPPSPRPPGIPIGLSDFRELRQPGVHYVDKTAFVAGVLAARDAVLLFPRPRRFGKTVNLSTLRCFVEKSAEDMRPLFAGLAIELRSEAWEHFQRYPVVFMTFKDVKASSFELALAAIRKQIRAAYWQHRYLLDGEALDEQQKHRFLQILGEEGDEPLYWESLLDLSAHLHRYHGEKVAILIDEYDTAIHAGFSAGYYDLVVQFFRNFLSGGLKDNPHLWKGVLTGILRVAKESIFSGLNNLSVFSMLRTEFSASFGFTPDEVAGLARAVGREAALPEMERWYNGYRFAGQVIYNPWSVLNFLASEDQVPQPYWLSTSSLDLVRDLLVARAGEHAGEIEALLQGKSITKRIDENVSLRDLPPDADLVWGFLLFTGYLTATRVRRRDDLVEARLKIPNREVRAAYRTAFRTWLAQALGDGDRVRTLCRALLAGDAETAERLLEDLVLRSLSFHDTGQGPGEPERVYHAFMLGLLVWLGPRYRVSSNREAGYGRCDVMIVPRAPGQAGVVMELKSVDKRRKETPAKAMAAALRQLRERAYAAEVRAAGAGAVREIGVVFDGKRVRVAIAEG